MSAGTDLHTQAQGQCVRVWGGGLSLITRAAWVGQSVCALCLHRRAGMVCPGGCVFPRNIGARVG